MSNQCIQLCMCNQCNGWWETQSSVMCGVRVNMMERQPLLAVGQKTTNRIRDTHIYIYIYIYIYINTVGGKLFDPLLILYVCPLTKKWSVYNFNGRFIWTVRDRITKKKKIQKNAFQKSYKLICFLMSEISIWSLINQQDFWLPCVYYTGKELRLGALS